MRSVMLVIALAVDVHSIILALGEAVVRRSIVCNGGTVDSRRVIGRDAADDDAVCSRTATAVDFAVLQNREFEVGLLCVGEGEFLF